jgi:type VI secretion system secreted protein VgrG
MPRAMEITTPLGPDVLLFHRMHAREEVGRIGECRLELLSPKNDINIDAILGKSVTVKLMLQDDSIRYFNGFVTSFSQGSKYGRYRRYYADINPWAWFMSRTADCRIFQEMTVPDIVKKVFEDHPTASFKDDLTGSYRTWEYCVQYRETDLNFVCRMMEHEGIYFYFTHEEGKHTLVMADSYSAHAPCQDTPIPFVAPEDLVRPDVEHISTWTLTRQIQPGVYAQIDYDFERPSVELKTKKPVLRGYTSSDYEVYDYPGRYAQRADGEQLAAVRINEFASQYETAQADTNAKTIAVGGLFNLERCPRADQNGEHLIVSATYDLEFSDYEAMPDRGGSEYRCSFVAMPSQQELRPRRLTPKPVMQGPQTAVVVGPAGDEIYTDKYGRIKVQFHWDRYGQRDENSSCWIRVSQTWAGKGWGSIVIPRIEQEVIVEFLEGDPDQPIVTGCVYNGNNPPPTSLPGAGVVSGLKSNTHKGKGFNEMTMDDTTGKEKITIHGQYDMNTTVQHDQTNTVNNDFTETIKKNATISITEGNLSHDVVTGTATYHVKGALDETYDDTQTTTVKNTLTIVSTAGPIAVSSDSQKITMTAATEIKLEVGASTLLMKADGSIELSGVSIAIDGAQKVAVHGGQVSSEADTSHDTKGNIVLSEGAATNTVKGGMVMLNP